MNIEFSSFFFFWPIASLFLAIVFIKLFLHNGKKIKTSISSSSSLAEKLPPGPWRLPIVGNMHNLFNKTPRQGFGDLAAKYGPLMMLRLGEINVVVATSTEAAAEIMKTHDVNFSYRPEVLVGKMLFYDSSDILYTSYGEQWRQLRRACNIGLFSPQRIKSFTHVREEEVNRLIARIAAVSSTGTTVDLNKEIFTLTSDVLCRAAFGQNCAQQQQFMLLIPQAFELLSGLSLLDHFPSLRFLSSLTRLHWKMKKLQQRVDLLIDQIIHDHQQKMKVSPEEEDDLVDVLLRVKKEDQQSYPLTMNNIKAVISDIFLGGTDTVSNVLHWAMAELMRSPEIRAKAQAEVRGVVGAGTIMEKHIPELKYLGLVVKETLRLHPPVPLLSPRLCKEECRIQGYTVPAGARVFINAWAISRDPKYWDDAERFRPERFEGGAIDLKGANFEFTPFGSGRRMCPGIGFALANIELALAHLLHKFEWELPDGMTPEDVDMKDEGGLTAKKEPLYVLAKPMFASSPCI